MNARVPVIGLEIHCQLLTRSKIFCACPARFGSPPNSQVCPVCLGHPGVLPTLNGRAVELAVMTGLALGSSVRGVSVFARKNYFYPDLPKGYQISQYEAPLCEGGSLDIARGARSIRIRRLHLEEDAGKMMHVDGGRSLVDLNRCGVPLVEIVTEPDLRSPGEAHEFLTRLRRLVRWLGVCDGNMEEGSLRCDANVSLRDPGSRSLGTKTEIKNLNSFRNVQRGLEGEIDRQAHLLDSGGTVAPATLLWDDERGGLAVMRVKEEAEDYRYFPEPDLPPLVLDAAWIETVRRSLPELPEARRERFVRDHGLPDYDAGVLTATRGLADFYEEAARIAGDAKLASNFVMTEVLGAARAETGDLGDIAADAGRVGDLLSRVRAGEISGRIAKAVFREMLETGREPGRIIESRGLHPVRDEEALRAIARSVLDRSAKEVAAYHGGRRSVFAHFVGQLMKETGGRADPRLATRILEEELDRRRKGAR
jgi:aspartyl-tRNA(Asn)/glutamyl-tRNA(Gln) amidotransferase subunit B